MSKKYRTPQAPKVRNFVAKAMLDPAGPCRPKTIRDKSKDSYRKAKHKNNFIKDTENGHS